jgi:hypothetical protein
MSTFDEVLAAVRDLLQREDRVAYCVLKWLSKLPIKEMEYVQKTSE